MIYIVVDRCLGCGDKVSRNNLIEGKCEDCRQEYFYHFFDTLHEQLTAFTLSFLSALRKVDEKIEEKIQE